jgi:hypothetical protein
MNSQATATGAPQSAAARLEKVGRNREPYSATVPNSPSANDAIAMPVSSQARVNSRMRTIRRHAARATRRSALARSRRTTESGHVLSQLFLELVRLQKLGSKEQSRHNATDAGKYQE